MKLTVPTDIPLIEALAMLSPKSSKTTLRSWLKEGRVTVDEEVVKIANTPIAKGQEVVVLAKPRFVEDKIRIIYEDKDIVVIEKPTGVLSVSTDFEKGETAHAMLKRKYRPKKVFVVHRLDQDTSGVMLFALSEKAYLKLKEMFEAHDIERAYTAIVEGHLESSSGTWTSHLYEDEQYVVRTTTDPAKGRLAVTHYQVTATKSRYSRLLVTLETGRKNQIRVHCAQAGHPVAGDKKYGATSNPMKRLGLHAHLLAFEHPILKKKMRFESPVPKEFDRVS